MVDCVDMELQFAKFSDIGGRSNNQDAVAHAVHGDVACFVIADGAGGHYGGEIASRIVADSVVGHFQKECTFGERALQASFDSAMHKLQEAKDNDSRLSEMSATVVTLLVDVKYGLASWGHLGDSRLYLFRRGKILQVTKDHSVAQQLVDAGLWPADKLRDHPQRNRLFAAMGAEMDTPPVITPEPVALLDGDALLMCTDGFWEWIEESQMETEFVGTASAEEWVASMNRIVAAKASTSPKPRDNCTVIAIWLGEPELVTIAL